MKHEISAGIILYNIIHNERHFLILNYPGGHWDFVKGKMESNETPRQTAIREMEEETGIIDIEFIDEFKEEISYTFFIKKEQIDKKVIFFLAETNSTQVRLSHEHLDFLWLRFDDAMEKITYENAKTILTKADNILDN